MKRTAIIAAWLASLVAAYLAGQAGIGRAPAGLPDAARPVPETSQDLSARMEPARTASAPVPAVDLIAQAEALVTEGRPYDALEILAEYFRATHAEATERHARALFLLSDLKQMTGEVEDALVPLFDILRYPPSTTTADRARRRLDLLINAREQQLINAGDLVGLVAYFERLVNEDPGYDGYRLKLARWLLRSGDVEAAARLAREIGLVGVTPAELEALEGEIRLAATALPVEREGGAMYTAASVSGRAGRSDLRLLIDTGATMTGMSESRLKALGAVLIEEGIRVQTANGVVALPVYHLEELRLGGLVLEDLKVLGFSDLPRRADGLLGMDVLSKLSSSLPSAVGRP